MNYQIARCLRHPSERVVGICGSCLKDRLTFLSSIEAHSFGPPNPSIELSSSHFQTGNHRAGSSNLLEGSTVCVDSVEIEPKQQWRSRSLCERGYVRESLCAVASSCKAASDGQFSRNLSRNKVTLRELFELNDSEEKKIKPVDAHATLCCERAVEAAAKGCQDAGKTVKEPSRKIQEEAPSGAAAETSNADEGSPGKSVCGAVCPASHGGKHSFWWATLRWRRKARQPREERSEGVVKSGEGETKEEGGAPAGAQISSASRKPAGADVRGRPYGGWRRSEEDTENPMAARLEQEGAIEAAKEDRKAESSSAGVVKRHLPPAAACGEDGGGEVEEMPVVHNQDSYRRPDYRSASCNAASTWYGTDYRTWEAYYSPAERSKLPAASMLERKVSRREDRGYLDRIRTVKISPAIADQSSLLRFYLTPLGTSSTRRRGSGRLPPPRSSNAGRGPWSFYFSR